MALNGTIIGHGHFGEVRRLGKHAPYVAVKSIKIHSERIKKYAERELKALEKVSHPNIVKFYGHIKKNLNGCDHLMIYMEFCDRLSLKNVLEDPTVVYNLKTVFGWTEHLASALLCLKVKEILHRDIKPENLFVTNRFFLKLGDFGLGKHLETGSLMSRVGTERYMSPEASGHFGNAETNYKSDLYAMGLVLWEIVERRKVFSPEYESQGIYAIFDGLRNGRYTLPFTDCDAKLKDLILQCTRFDHNSRPDIEDCLKKTAGLNSNYNEETFQPLIQINQQAILKPNCIRKANTEKKDLLQKELIDQLEIKKTKWFLGSFWFDDLFVHLDNGEHEHSTFSMNKSLNDAILMLKSLAIQQGDLKLLAMFEKQIQSFSRFPDDYVFCNYEYPKFPPMIDQELLDHLSEQKYGEHFVQNIKSALEICEQCFRNDFRTWLNENLKAIHWYYRANWEDDSLLEAIEQIHSIIDRISDNPFYKQWLVLSCDKRSGKGLLSRKRNDTEIKPFLFLLKGFHIESCLKDLQERLESVLKDMNYDHAILKDYLQRYQPRECVFPFRAYRFEWGKRVDECEEIKMSDIDSEILNDYESLRQAYEFALQILVTHSKREEKSFHKKDQINQIETCLLELGKPRKCPNYFYFHAIDWGDDEREIVDILCIGRNGANEFGNLLGDDLIWRWKKNVFFFYPPFTIVEPVPPSKQVNDWNAVLVEIQLDPHLLTKELMSKWFTEVVCTPSMPSPLMLIIDSWTSFQDQAAIQKTVPSGKQLIIKYIPPGATIEIDKGQIILHLYNIFSIGKSLRHLNPNEKKLIKS